MRRMRVFRTRTWQTLRAPPRLRVASQIGIPIITCASVTLCIDVKPNRRGRHPRRSVRLRGRLNQRIEVNPPSEHDAYLVLVVSVSGGVL
jgi:hypothetical protein